ncbi:hypothetical protein NIES4071_14090 [Calothrix sp. NIES-4071]|nr:hypothetical protein NIES4071_14090 [Calothrix sp. NIES-4071]BAZ55747.1 hypothetical protein NIES4105_14040 [Calothrix sp. NIES-4105]
MRVIDLSATKANLTEILSMASDEAIIIRTPEGRKFMIPKVDDFTHSCCSNRSKSRTDGIFCSSLRRNKSAQH